MTNTRRTPLSRRIARRTTIFRVTASIIAVIFATVLAIIILAHTAQPTWPSKPIPTTPVFEQQAATSPAPHNDLTDEDTSDAGLPPVSAKALASACQGHTGMYHDTPNTWINCDQKPTAP